MSPVSGNKLTEEALGRLLGIPPGPAYTPPWYVRILNRHRRGRFLLNIRLEWQSLPEGAPLLWRIRQMPPFVRFYWWATR